MTNGIDLLEQNILIDLDVSIPLGVSRGKPEDVGLAEEGMPKAVFALIKHYLPKDWTAAHRALEGRANRLIAEHASPVTFPLGKARLLLSGALEAVVGGLAAIRGEFDEATAAKVDGTAYAEMRREALAAHPQFREALEHCFPEAGEMRGRFRFAWHTFEIALPKGAKVQLLRKAKASNLQVVLAEEADRARASVRDFYGRHVAAITGEVQEVCAKVADRVAKGEIIRESTLDGVAKRLAWFERMCAIVDPAQAKAVLGQVGKLRALIGGTLASDVNADAATGARFQAALAAAGDACTKLADVSGAAGRYVRKLGLED